MSALGVLEANESRCCIMHGSPLYGYCSPSKLLAEVVGWVQGDRQVVAEFSGCPCLPRAAAMRHEAALRTERADCL